MNYKNYCDHLLHVYFFNQIWMAFDILKAFANFEMFRKIGWVIFCLKEIQIFC